MKFRIGYSKESWFDIVGSSKENSSRFGILLLKQRNDMKTTKWIRNLISRFRRKPRVLVTVDVQHDFVPSHCMIGDTVLHYDGSTSLDVNNAQSGDSIMHYDGTSEVV